MDKQNVVFTVDEVNQMINYLAEIPARYSMDLISFIRTKAQSQIKQENPAEDIEQEE